MYRVIVVLLAALFLTGAAPPAPDPENVIELTVGSRKEVYGTVVIRLRPDLAPRHVERVKALARRKFYDGVPFHRVIPGFMAQTGDPTGTGQGGSDLPDLEPEFTPTPHWRGTVSMARAEAPNSANSQFFLMLNDKPDLDGRYTVFGEIIGGIQFLDRLKAGTEENDGAIDGVPDRIIRMRVRADGKS